MIFKKKEKESQKIKESKSENLEKIIKKGDNNLPLTTEEIQIYIKHLIANKNHYINEEYYDHDILELIEIVALIIGGFISIVPLVYLFISLSNNDIYNIISCLKIIVCAEIPTITYAISSKIIRKKNARKKVNNKILDLKASLELENTLNFDESLEQIKNMIKINTSTKKYSNDAFIATIKRDMEQVAEIKYTGYLIDLETLYTLAEQYLNAKRKMNTTSPTDILNKNEWFKPVIEIEARIRQNTKVIKDQSDIIEALTEMKELYLKETINKPITETLENNEQNLTLIL